MSTAGGGWAPPTVGVEEEYLLVDPDTGVPVAAAEEVMRRAAKHTALGGREVQHELLQAQIEVGTPVCATLHEVAGNLLRMRHALGAAAEEAGCRLVATAAAGVRASAPIPVTEDARYRAIGEHARRLVDEQLICGMHVHVTIPDPDTGVAVLNRIRPWLGLLLAISANSPVWEGERTGFASWRHVVFSRWPVTGIPPAFHDGADYHGRAAALVDSGLIADTGQLYWSARLSRRYPTIEVRVTDVQLRVEEAVLLTGLIRALVTRLGENGEKDGKEGKGASAPPFAAQAREWLDAALWYGARHGLTGLLPDPWTGRLLPAVSVVRDAIEYLAPVLTTAGDTAHVVPHLHHVLTQGNGAQRQCQALVDGGQAALHRLLVRETGAMR
jgi:carboxylate-amine ligase